PAADLEVLLAPPTPIDADRSRPVTGGSMETEQALIALLEELLDITGVDREDNFFAVGGDSIISVQLAARATAQGLALTPAMVFEHMTIAALAAAVDAAAVSSAAGADSGSVQQAAPMSASGLGADALAELTASWLKES
ncbi:MAG: phosphopantetheine-binding protein, partial [Mycobacterium sp.]